MKRTLMIAAMMTAPYMLSGCDKKADAPKEEAAADTMGGMEMPADAKMGKGTGTVTAIDAESGKITLEHGAIPAVEWSAMTMGFSAKPELLKGIVAGDVVTFEMRWDGKNGEITNITKAAR